MPQQLTTTQAKSAMQGAGAPPEVVAAAEAKGLDLGELWTAIQQVPNILNDSTKTTWEKVWAIVMVFVPLLPGSAP